MVDDPQLDDTQRERVAKAIAATQRARSWDWIGDPENYRVMAQAAIDAMQPELEREREQWQDVINDWADAYMRQARELDRLKAGVGR